MKPKSSKSQPLQRQHELPEVLYDEPLPGQPPNPFPFIKVSKEGKMPSVIFIEERKETGETEPGSNGESVEIIMSEMHKFMDLEVLKEKLPPHLNDIVRVAVGLKPLKEAQESGQAILDKVRENIKKDRKQDLLATPQTKKTQ